MNTSIRGNASERRMKFLKYILLIAVGLLINLLFSKLAVTFELPLYLDNIGVMLTAALGGYIPGIIVAYLTNIINGISDPMTTYYAAISVLIAVFAAWCARHGWFKKALKIVAAILVFAAIGGILGSILTWMLYGFDFGSGVSAPLAHAVYDNLIPNVFTAQLLGDFLLDILDKAITVVIVLIILKILPVRLKDSLNRDFAGWRQRPLTKEEEAEVTGRRRGLKTLGAKITFIISAAMLVIAVVTTLISFSLFNNAAIEDQTSMGWGLLNVASELIDADRVDEFIREGSAASGYDETEAALDTLRRSSPDIEYVYVYQILEDGCHVVFDPDTEELPGADPGEVVPFDEAFSDYLPALLSGQEIEPVISNETYGWLLTLYKPLYDSSGKCVCYAAVDIAMDDIMVGQYSFLARVISLFLGFFILIIAIVLRAAKYSIIMPVDSMTVAAQRFAFNSEEIREGSVSYIKGLDIRTGDEIEDLYHAFTRTSEDMVQYVADVHEKTETISRMQNRLIEVMADMVESRDKYTGHHVRNTAAYAAIIMDEMRSEGLYADVLTDEYIEDVIHSAPLHDIGKIQVSDTILNKPGRLTDEEFDIMKSHTVEGSKIIAKAADAVSESGYLDEAERLAAYHHEKWNGTGYPYGISGEEIPLSARIMAVADVFDALVSKRSYKEGFPVDKALDIIREGIGTHFDPQVAQAFLNAEERVRAVAEEKEETTESETKREDDNEKK